MNEEKKNQIALFRYGVIAPFVQRQCEDTRPWTFFKNASERKYENPDGEMVTISTETIGRWYRWYRDGGFDALKPKARVDLGKQRKLDDELKDIIIHYIEEYPRLPAVQIYEKLKETGRIINRHPSLSTITRFVSGYKKSNRLKPLIERKRYERENINEVWCGDSSVGPYIRVDDVKRKTYIIALMDDASRMITGIGVFFEDSFVNLMKVIKSAVSKYGKPRIFNFDNGSNYKANQMKLLSARIGTAISYCHPYSPEEKAKIERWFRTLKDQWMSLIHSGDYHSLKELEESLLVFTEEYNRKVHSSLNGMSPQERFFSQSKLIVRMSEEEIERSFLLEIERRVSPDSVIVIDDKEYEVDYRLQNQKITLRYSPDLSHVYVVDPYDSSLKEIRLLDKKSNSKLRRKKVAFTQANEEADK